MDQISLIELSIEKQTSTQKHSGFILYILPFLCLVTALYGEPAQARDTVILITSGARKRRLYHPPPQTQYSGKYLGSTVHSILIILILNSLETGQHSEKFFMQIPSFKTPHINEEIRFHITYNRLDPEDSFI